MISVSALLKRFAVKSLGLATIKAILNINKHQIEIRENIIYSNTVY